MREPLTHLAERLPASLFLRVHRSAIVNTSKVRAAEPFDQGDQLLILRNGKRITTGRSYRKAVKDFLKRAMLGAPMRKGILRTALFAQSNRFRPSGGIGFWLKGPHFL